MSVAVKVQRVFDRSIGDLSTPFLGKKISNGEYRYCTSSRGSKTAEEWWVMVISDKIRV